MYGDMQVQPFQYVKKSKNYDASKWPNCESTHVSPQSNILANLEPIREDHMSYISQLSRHSNEVGTPSNNTHLNIEHLELLNWQNIHTTNAKNDY